MMVSTQCSHVMQRCNEGDLNQDILMRQRLVVAQVLAHNAVHAAFAGFTGVTVRDPGSAPPARQSQVLRCRQLRIALTVHFEVQGVMGCAWP